MRKPSWRIGLCFLGMLTLIFCRNLAFHGLRALRCDRPSTKNEITYVSRSRHDEEDYDKDGVNTQQLQALEPVGFAVE